MPSQFAAKSSPQADGEPTPQLGSMPSKENVTDVVIALTADWLTDVAIFDVVCAIASERLPVLALTASATTRVAHSGSPHSVHRAETRSGKRDKQLWVLSNRRWNIVMAAVEPSVNELPYVAGVQVRT
ncbi:hypothetical protein DVS77_21190 [Mycolicibacterium moriokaense]|nr:hypothetical protein DVS77_21190 [Mycolicibacterium moriokaense]